MSPVRAVLWYGGWVVSAAFVVALVVMAYTGVAWAPSPSWAASSLLAAACLDVVGLLMWRRRPGNPVGPLLVAVGLLNGLNHLMVAPSGITLVAGFVANLVQVVVLAHALLVFPDGRFHARSERVFVVVAYGLVVLLQVARLLLSRTNSLTGCAPRDCPHNPMGVLADLHLAREVRSVSTVVQLVLVVVFVWLLARRVLRAGPVVRRAYVPTLGAIGLLIAQFAASRVAGFFMDAHSTVYNVFGYAQTVGAAALPVAMAYGLLRARPNVADLVTRLERCPPERVRDELAAVLDDPTLQVALRRPDGEFVDVAGVPVDVGSPGRTRTVVDADTVLLHDASLLSDESLLRAASAAARLSLDNARLHAEVRAQLREVRESRARLAQAAFDERRRIERDLHDGAQQRLLGVGLSIQQAREQLPADSSPARALDEAAAEVMTTLNELRELARGLRPALLVERGLSGAIPDLVRRSPLAVRVDLDLDHRLPDAVEATGYFVVSEALQNAARHARATQAEIVVHSRDGRMSIRVADNGVGGADQRDGSGLRGLADRVAAVAGTLTVSSPPGSGTTISVEIPCG